MSSSNNTSLTFLGQQITIYGGFLIMLIGILGNFISMIVFLSLRTFRQSSCAFYLTIMSFVNTGQLLFGLLSRILITGYGIDWTSTSIIVCKLRSMIVQFCSFVSYSCLCLATIDQYFSTCTHIRWQHWCNIKFAHRLIIISIIVSVLLLSPYPIFLNHVILRSSQISCTITNEFISQYRNYFIALLASGYIPDFISTLFGILAYRNVQKIVHRRIPLIRRELDKQLTTMVLVQVVINLFTNVPSVTIFTIMQSITDLRNNFLLEQIQFAQTVTFIIFYTYFASSFYIYMYVSERFRRQLIYVFRVIHGDQWGRQRIFINQILPI